MAQYRCLYNHHHHHHLHFNSWLLCKLFKTTAICIIIVVIVQIFPYFSPHPLSLSPTLCLWRASSASSLSAVKRSNTTHISSVPRRLTSYQLRQQQTEALASRDETTAACWVE